MLSSSHKHTQVNLCHESEPSAVPTVPVTNPVLEQRTAMSPDTTATQSTVRLSYNDFEVAIRAFLKQVEHHSPWSYIEYRVSRSAGHSEHVGQLNEHL